MTATRHARGVAAEEAACRALEAEGWTVLRRRARTKLGEVDVVAERGGLLALVEVKRRASFAAAAESVSPRQRARLLAAAELLLAAQPDWGPAGVRFDVMVVNGEGQVRRIADAFRLGD